jgi:hypothetical protein
MQLIVKYLFLAGVVFWGIILDWSHLPFGTNRAFLTNAKCKHALCGTGNARILCDK